MNSRFPSFIGFEVKKSGVSKSDFMSDLVFQCDKECFDEYNKMCHKNILKSKALLAWPDEKNKKHLNKKDYLCFGSRVECV